jgi:Fibronectin type III domain
MQVSHVVRRGVVAAAIVLSAAPVFATASYAAGSPPAQPTGLTLVAGNRVLFASWTESSTGPAVFTATATAAGHPTRHCRTRAHRCFIVPLANGVSYSVTVVAKNTDGSSAASDPASAIVGVPTPPRDVHARAGKGGQALVRWAPPIASGVTHVTGYTATATSASDGPFTCSTTGAKFCVLTGLTKGTVYTVSVTATNKYGTSVASKSTTVTAK